MNNLHAYIQADLKYNLTRSKSKQYSNLLHTKHNAQTHKKQSGGVIIGNNNKHKFEIKVNKYGGVPIYRTPLRYCESPLISILFASQREKYD